MPDPTQALACFIATARAIAGPMDYDRVLKNFAACLRSLIPHDHLDIVLLHRLGTQICYEACLHTSWSQRHHYTPTEISPIRDVLRGKAPYFLSDDAHVDPRFHFDGADASPIFEANLRSRIVVPLRVQGDIIGSLAISSHQVAHYDDGLVEIAQGAADLVSAYLFALERGKDARDAAVAESEARNAEEALRLGAQRLTEGMESERQRLGMDLHDQTLADLARVSRRVAALRRKGRFDDRELMAIEDDLETCLDDLRGIVEDMKPGVLQMFGFAEAVEAHMRRSVAQLRMDCRVSVVDASDGRVDVLPGAVRTSLYRIVQEAVNNALKHSAASMISVRVAHVGSDLLVEVDDDGKGIKTLDLASQNGIGIIRTRAALISAAARISRRSREGGTRVAIIVPSASEGTEPAELVRYEG